MKRRSLLLAGSMICLVLAGALGAQTLPSPPGAPPPSGDEEKTPAPKEIKPLLPKEGLLERETWIDLGRQSLAPQSAA